MDIQAHNPVGNPLEAAGASSPASARPRPLRQAVDAALGASHEGLLQRAQQADRTEDAEAIAQARLELQTGQLDTETQSLHAADILLKFGI